MTAIAEVAGRIFGVLGAVLGFAFRNLKITAVVLAVVVVAGYCQRARHPQTAGLPNAVAVAATPSPPILLNGVLVSRAAWCPLAYPWAVRLSPLGAAVPACLLPTGVVYAGLYTAKGCTEYAPMGAVVEPWRQGLIFDDRHRMDLRFWTRCS